ncbi:polyamine aminopropyltransferase [Paraferrimonas sedimenticola]|uniref:Polyamine aminopropyltransferase n=1 Tax=Paraferrimonas sedimenticola TaxID=375674 RepID=A0AA37RV98_9GAMM|nr:polyamine aminopropyltransferase [Paraferrimonas sedimenticola]GLP95673.1 polyamine aminopropyltransferase [Paraferrimonas sedimenticola]
MTRRQLARFDDVLLLGIMTVLAGCGLIYEYLLSHYAGRVLGAMDSAIFTMIGLMIVSMGLGAFAARSVRCAFSGFAVLELLVAIIGSVAILLTAAIIGLTQVLPAVLADTFGLPQELAPSGGVLARLQKLAQYLPYVWGVILGWFIGMEIPLIARVRQDLASEHLKHNAGTIYGADYIGAGIGAAIWVLWMLTINTQTAAAITASVNLIAGLAFLWRYWGHIRRPKLLAGLHGIAAILLMVLAWQGPDWQHQFNNLLYQDKVVFNQDTRFQKIVLTERQLGTQSAPVYSLYLNGRLQFSSQDEAVYHSFLVHPAMAASARQEQVLIIGGGDGLALKHVLQWHPQRVTLMDLDEQLVRTFKEPEAVFSRRIATAVSELTQNSLKDPRVELRYADAFNGADELISEGRFYDVIVVDLPDPSHPDINKVYSDQFYAKLNQLLSADGVIAVQSTSPYHARKAFISVGKTLTAAGFRGVEQYHHNVPSFGQWGWSIATKSGLKASQRLARLQEWPSIDETWLTPQLALAAFAFPGDFYRDKQEVKVNRFGSNQLYQYHQQAWSRGQGLNFNE